MSNDPKRAARVVALPGDGVGPEVCAQAVRVLEICLARAGRQLELVEMKIGGVAVDGGDEPLPARTKEACLQADAVLLGAVGGPQYDELATHLRPEKGLLDLRKALGVYANVRPVRAIPALESASPLRAEIVRGTDLVVVRELLGGIYFGEPKGTEGDRAFNTMVYSEPEVRRIAKIAFELAQTRRKHVYSIDKANVLDVSRLWRRVVGEVHAEYPDVTLAHQYVDSAAMDIVRQPTKFDVILTGNLFGDILTDEAAVLAGSIGLLSSASLGDGPGLYEPIHGSAPDIAGRGVANPIGAIASAASALHSSLGLPDEAKRVEEAIDRVLAAGHRTKDLGGNATTQQTGDQICQVLESPG